MSLSSSAIRATIPLVIAVVFGVCRRYLPPQEGHPFTEQDARRFSSFRMQCAVAITMIAVATLVFLTARQGFIWANFAFATREKNPVFLLLPDKWIWFAAPFFGAISISWEITLRLWSIVEDPLEARKYESWSNRNARFNTSKVLRGMTLVIALPGAVLTFMAIPIHTSLNDQGISIGHYATPFLEYHPYTDIRKITVTRGLRLRDGSLQERAAITVDFSDGDRWSSADNRPYEQYIDQPLLELLVTKSGQPATYVDAFPFGQA